MLSISKEQVNSLPEVRYPGKVILVDSPSKAKSALSYLKKVSQIGFDTETRPSFQKYRHYNVSLMQLSAGEECFLFRLKEIGSLEPLMELLEDENIQKIGLSIKDDFHSLAKLAEFTPRGFVELQTFVKDFAIADNSLQKIYGIIFGQRISKNQRLTNWEAPTLTPSQQNYAAIDAWACQKIYNYLVAGSFDPSLSPYTVDDETALAIAHNAKIPDLNCRHKLVDGEGHVEVQPAGETAAKEASTESGKPKRKRSSKKQSGDSAGAADEPSTSFAPMQQDSDSERRKKSDKRKEQKSREKKAELEGGHISTPSISLRQIIHNIFRW